MPIPARYKLCLVALAVILANTLDLASTYYVSPDLAGEWNLLERKFGMGWTGLVAAKALGIWLAILGYAYYLRYRDACYPPPGAERRAFRYHVTFGRQVNWLQMQTGIPLGRYLGVNLGYFWAGMQGLVVWVALENLLLRYGIYCPLRHTTEMGYHLLQSVVVAGAVLGRFYQSNWRRYLSLTQHTPVSSPPSTAVGLDNHKSAC